MKGNIDFPIDWYKATGILPSFVDALMHIDTWWSSYGVQFITILSILTMIAVALYFMVWRVFFKDYIMDSEGGRTFEGRVYWRTNNMWTALWDRFYHSPKREVVTYFIKQTFWPPINVLNPLNSLIRLDTGADEVCEPKGVYALLVRQKGIWHKVDNNPRHLATLNVRFSDSQVASDYAEEFFVDMGVQCVTDTQKLSYANPEIRNDIVRGDSSLITPQTKEAIASERKIRKAREQQAK
jgi:hypothetical protein